MFERSFVHTVRQIGNEGRIGRVIHKYTQSDTYVQYMHIHFWGVRSKP